MTHAELAAEVTRMCRGRGLLWHQCADRPYRCHGTAGFPDLVIAGPAGLVLAELKSDGDETTGWQDLWAWTITRTWRPGEDTVSGWRLWRPAQLEDGTIAAALDALAG